MWLSEHEAGALEDAADDYADAVHAAREQVCCSAYKALANAKYASAAKAEEILDAWQDSLNDYGEITRALADLIREGIAWGSPAARRIADQIAASYANGLSDQAALREAS